jgi:hypothetical protein
VESFLQWIRWKREEAEQRHDLEMVVAADGLETLAVAKLAAVHGVREIGSDQGSECSIFPIGGEFQWPRKKEK